MRNCLDSEEAASQNSWELLRSGWEEGRSFFFLFVCCSDLSEGEDGDRRCETESRDGSTEKSGGHMLGGCWQGGVSFCGCPAPSGYGEDGVHSREAADKKKAEDWKKLMRK